jgi:Rrf2 family protein
LATLPVGTFAGAADLAKHIGAPPNYLGKLLQGIAAQGLVESRKGAGGGFRLTRSPEEISVLAVVDPIDHPSAMQGCFLGQLSCSDEAPCPVHARWAQLRKQYLALLAETTIAEIAHRESQAWLRPD